MYQIYLSNIFSWKKLEREIRKKDQLLEYLHEEHKITTMLKVS